MSAKKGYKKIYEILIDKKNKGETVTITEISTFSGLKETTLKTYIRNKLKDKFVTKVNTSLYKVKDEIESYDDIRFCDWMSQKSLSKEEFTSLHSNLLNNSMQSMISAVELHNKPQISYRYQMVVILVINSWELAMKSFISKTQPNTRLFKPDGSTKTFTECIRNIESSLGKKIFSTTKNLEILYKYRCDFIHYYNDDLNIVLFSLIQKSIVMYDKFISIYFNRTLTEFDDVSILPIGFKKPISPLDFLTNESSIKDSPFYIKEIVNDILLKTEELNEENIDDMIFIPYAMNISNIKRVKNADIIAALDQNSPLTINIEENIIFSNDKTAKKIRIDEDQLYDKYYRMHYKDVVTFCRQNIPGWKQNSRFNDVMKDLKKIDKYHRVRLLDPMNPKSTKQSFYSEEIFKELKSIYSKT